MSAIKIKHRGSFQNTERFLNKMRKQEIFEVLHKYGKIGVEALAANTPKDTGHTAGSWSYEINKAGKSYSITWNNDNIIPGHGPLVIMLHYGHGTGTGGYVHGRDFILPTIRPIFDDIADSVWREVQNA